MKKFDYVVVGSGCSGAMAAQTLVESGKNVTMIDVGVINENDNNLPYGKNFLDIRNNDRLQYKYFIGGRGEGINWGEISKGAQITPPRRYMTSKISEYIPFTSNTFSPLESLGYGGLGISWGLQCWEYSNADLTKVGMNPKETRLAYDIIGKRIGISATSDDAAKYTIGELKNFQPSANADKNHTYILEKFEKKKKTFLKQGLHVGRTPLALITRKTGGRKAYRYLDTDFYSDNDESAWRPWITINNLRKKDNFTYIGAHLVVRFEEIGDEVIIHTIDIRSNESKSFKCDHLVLASGALGTARIAIRSQKNGNNKVPLLSNPHSYIPCVQPKMFGKGYEKKKLGFGQLSYFIDPKGDDSEISVASSYSYQSLMLFRIIAQIPFNFADGRIVSRYLTPGLIVMIAQHPDYQSPNKYLRLIKDTSSITGDRLEAHYQLSSEDEAEWDKRERKYASILRKLRTYPIRRIKTEHGSAIHYAGTLPFSETPKKLHLHPSGRIHYTKHVYVADSSGFRFLPAKGLTFTLMANAHIVANNLKRGNF